MSLESYKNRNIYDINDQLINDDKKDEIYLQNIAYIQTVLNNDTSSHNLGVFLVQSKNYIDTNLNINKPIERWTEKEVLRKMRTIRREVGFGRIGLFESSDRVRNFKARMRDSAIMLQQLNAYNEFRNNSFVDATITAQASGLKLGEIKNQAFNRIALNWIPFLTRLKNENVEEYRQNFPSLDPARVLKNFTEETPDSLLNTLDMFQIIEDVDMEEFRYTDNQSFIENFGKKYEKLKAIADGPALIEYYKSQNNNELHTRNYFKNGQDSDLNVIQAKSKLASEMLADYEIRMRLITSPYYALFAGKDFERLPVERINAMKKGAGHEALDAYLDDVIAFKNKKAEALSYKDVNVVSRLDSYITGIAEPPQPPVVRLQSDIVLEQMVNLIRVMADDSKRATVYPKLKRACRNYLDASEEQKDNLLNDVITAVNTYENERSRSSSRTRHERCLSLLQLNETYRQHLQNENQAVLDAENARIQAENERLQAEQKRQEDEAKELARRNEARKKLEDELKQKADDIHKTMSVKVVEQMKKEDEDYKDLIAAKKRERREIAFKKDVDEYLKKITIARLRKEREQDLADLAAKIKRKTPDFLKAFEKEEAERLERINNLVKIERENAIFVESMNQATKSFSELGTIGKTAKDSQAVRKQILAFFDKYVFDKDKKIDDKYDRSYLDTMPTAMLVNVINSHIKDYDPNDTERIKYAEAVKKDILSQCFEFNGTHDEMRKPLLDITNKKLDEITELDRLNAYDYIVHVINYEKKGGIKYEDLINIDLAKLTDLTINLINHDESFIDDDGQSLEDLPIETQQKHIDSSANILSICSGKSADIFKYLHIDMISEYAEEAINKITNPKEQKKFLENVYKDACATKERFDVLNEALESNDKSKIIESIGLITGEDQKDLISYPFDEIKNIAKHMFKNYQYKDNMLDAYKDNKNEILSKNEDYYREIFLDISETGLSEKLTEDIRKTQREYGYTYVMKALGMDTIPVKSLDKLNDEALYKLVSNIGVLKYLDYKENKLDREKAAKELDSLNLSNELKLAIADIIVVSPEKISFKKALKDNDVDEEYANRAATDPFVIQRPFLGQKKNEDKLNKINDNVIRVENKASFKEFEELTADFQALIADLYYVMGKKSISTTEVSDVVFKHADAFGRYMTYKHGRKSYDIFGDLVKGVQPQEKAFILGAQPLLDDLSDFFDSKLYPDPKNIKLKFVRETQIRDVLKNNKLEIDLKKNAKILDDVVKKAEPELIKYMNNSTNEAFDLIGGYGIPDIFNFEDSADVDKKNLDFYQNSLRYNKEHGQGKFLQTMMNDYYKDSAKEDRRLMLSYIIKDFKRDDTRNAKTKGGLYFASSLKGAGPIMQKMMQGVPESMVVPELRTAFNIVKSGLSSIDKKEVNKVLDTIVNNSDKKIKKINIKKKLGAASVAETFLVNIIGKDDSEKEAVIKIRRPDVKNRMNRELPLIKNYSIYADYTDKEVAGIKAKYKGNIPPHHVRATEAGFLAQLSEIEKEFNFKNEAENCKTGQKKYGGKNPKVKSVELVNIPTAENYLVMTKAEGKTLDRELMDTRERIEKAISPYQIKGDNDRVSYKITLRNVENFNRSFDDINYEIKKCIQDSQLVGEVALVWTDEALYGSAWKVFDSDNFRHGDLHSGNIIIGENGDNATILDYGNATMIDYSKVTIILEMMSAVVVRNAELFVEAFNKFLKIAINEDNKLDDPIGYKELTPKQSKAYEKELKKIFSTGEKKDAGKTAGIKILLALTTAQSLGIKLPNDLQNFSQCQQRIENSMIDVRNTALDAKLVLNQLERMPLDRNIENSMDPLIVFHRRMNKKDDKGKYVYSESYYAAHDLYDEVYPVASEKLNDGFTALIKESNNGAIDPKKITELKENYLYQYIALKNSYLGTEKLKLDTFPAKCEEWRKFFKEAKEHFTKDGKLTEEENAQIRVLSGFFSINAHDTKITCFYDSTDYVYDLQKKAFNPPYDELAFEKLMNICEVDIAGIADAYKMFDYTANVNNLTSEQAEEFGQKSDMANTSMFANISKQSKIVIELLDRIRYGDLDVFEKEMSRFFKRNPNLEKAFTNYKNERKHYDSLTLENSKEEFRESRKRLNQFEDVFVKKYCDFSSKIFMNLKQKTRNFFTMKDLSGNSYMPAYTDVMFKIINKYEINTYKRLDGKIVDELKKYKNEMLELAKKEEEAKQKLNENAANGKEQPKAAMKK